MPLGPIVDSHVHLWDPTRFRMPWLDGNARIGKPFGLAEFREHSLPCPPLVRGLIKWK